MLSRKRLVRHILQLVQCWNSKLLATGTNLSICKNFYLKKLQTQRTNDADLGTGADAANTELPYFGIRALRSMFSECTVSANGVKFSKTHDKYAQRVFIET